MFSSKFLILIFLISAIFSQEQSSAQKKEVAPTDKGVVTSKEEVRRIIKDILAELQQERIEGMKKMMQ